MIAFTHLQEALGQYAQAIADRYKQNLESSGRRASGNFIDKIKTNVKHNGNEFSIELDLEPYYKYIEEGTGAAHLPDPHSNYWPPSSAIISWMTVKNILPTGVNPNLPTEKQYKQAAFLIGRAIAGKSPNQPFLKNPQGGTSGTFDLEHTMDELGDKWEDIIQEALDADVMDCIDELFALFN